MKSTTRWLAAALILASTTAFAEGGDWQAKREAMQAQAFAQADADRNGALDAAGVRDLQHAPASSSAGSTGSPAARRQRRRAGHARGSPQAAPEHHHGCKGTARQQQGWRGRCSPRWISPSRRRLASPPARDAGRAVRARAMGAVADEELMLRVGPRGSATPAVVLVERHLARVVAFAATRPRQPERGRGRGAGGLRRASGPAPRDRGSPGVARFVDLAPPRRPQPLPRPARSAAARRPSTTPPEPDRPPAPRRGPPARGGRRDAAPSAREIAGPARAPA